MASGSRFSQATGDAPVLPLLLIMAGGYLAWFGIHYWEDATIIWPSDPVKSVLQGKGVPPHTTTTTAAVELTSAEQGASQGAAPPPGGLPPTGSIYNHTSLMGLWVIAGGSQSSANNAACHGMQESQGDPFAQSANPDGGINVGLWQLDTKGVGAGHSVAELENPLTNARITVQATNDGQDWSQWATPGCPGTTVI